jgi:hypothetical protein
VVRPILLVRNGLYTNSCVVYVVFEVYVLRLKNGQHNLYYSPGCHQDIQSQNPADLLCLLIHSPHSVLPLYNVCQLILIRKELGYALFMIYFEQSEKLVQAEQG